MDLKEILTRVAAGDLSIAGAGDLLRGGSESNLGFARIDIERHRRCGLPEVVFSAGKTPEQVAAIVTALKDAGQDILCTRASQEVYESVAKAHPDATYHQAARMISLRVKPAPAPIGKIALVCAGTSDIPVAEEAGLTAEWMGAAVERLYDVGVAGLHRLVKHLDMLRSARAIIVVAGMEGALPSVVGGLIDKPIVAVPTSVGYGVHLQGLTPLLAMLNSCVPGISVVNIDNGFGAGVTAALINRLGETK